MDYEKKYKDALERAKTIKGFDNETGNSICEYIFPELKENEDERIRKELIKGFQHYDKECKWGEFTTTEIIAWLEKQGQVKESTISQYEKIEKRQFDFFKFYKGDWIVSNDGRSVFFIKDINNGFCSLEDTEGIIHSPCLPSNSDFHRWTIQDAKDGEVIAWDNSNCIALFKNTYDKESFHSHGFVGHITGEFVSEISYHDIAGAHPATKEQRNLFFQKMKESGYEWDAEKKELKEIDLN